jgi:hypothetical protein
MREIKRLRAYRSPQRFQLCRFNRRWLLAGILGAIVLGATSLEAGFRAAGCDIKGNISYATGERIYHVPNQKYYSATFINFLQGERFFCSEAAARKAGWRRSLV